MTNAIYYGFIILAVLYLTFRFVFMDKLQARQLRKIASDKGFTFQTEDQFNILERLKGSQFVQFMEGHHHSILNLLSGEHRTIKVRAFEYKSVIGKEEIKYSTDQQGYIRKFIVLFELKEGVVPGFTLRKTGPFRPATVKQSPAYIDMSSVPRFAGKYLLFGEEKGILSSRFTPVATDIMKHDRWSEIICDGRSLIVCFKHAEGGEIRKNLDSALAFFDLIAGL